MNDALFEKVSPEENDGADEADARCDEDYDRDIGDADDGSFGGGGYMLPDNGFDAAGIEDLYGIDGMGPDFE